MEGRVWASFHCEGVGGSRNACDSVAQLVQQQNRKCLQRFKSWREKLIRHAQGQGSHQRGRITGVVSAPHLEWLTQARGCSALRLGLQKRPRKQETDMGTWPMSGVVLFTPRFFTTQPSEDVSDLGLRIVPRLLTLVPRLLRRACFLTCSLSPSS